MLFDTDDERVLWLRLLARLSSCAEAMAARAARAGQGAAGLLTDHMDCIAELEKLVQVDAAEETEVASEGRSPDR